MPESTETNTKNALREAYDELNEKEKEKLRSTFCIRFEYSSQDSFYRKMNKDKDSKFWSIEQEWLAEYFKKTVKELFS